MHVKLSPLQGLRLGRQRMSERPSSPASDPPEPTHCFLCGEPFSSRHPRHKHHRDCCKHCIRDRLLSMPGIDMSDRRPWIDRLYAGEAPAQLPEAVS